MTRDNIAELAQIRATTTGKKIVFRRASVGVEIIETFYPNGDHNITTKTLKQETEED